MTACRDKIRPEIVPFYEVCRDVEPGRSVAVVRIERGYTAHHLWHNNHRTWMIRAGTRVREASQEELARLLAQRQAFRVDVAPVSGSGLADLDRRRLRDYFVRVRGQTVPDHEDLTTERMRAGCRAARNPMIRDVMQDYGYMEAQGMGVPRKIIAAVLAAGRPEPTLEGRDEEVYVALARGVA